MTAPEALAWVFAASPVGFGLGGLLRMIFGWFK